MRTTIGLALAAALAAGSFAAKAEDAYGPGACAGGRGPRRVFGPRRYDPQTVKTLTGEVAAVDAAGRGRRGGGVALELKTAEGTVPVRVGPSWFLEEGLQLAQGDKVEITGSEIQLGGKPALIAQVVKKGSVAVALRDINGIPVWSRCGSR